MNFTFKIYANNIIDEYVVPDNSEVLDIVPYVMDGQRIIRNKLSTNVILSGEFYYIYDIIKSNPCVQFSFIIHRECDNYDIYKGLFTVYNIGNVDQDYCTFDFGMTTDDIYTRFMNVWKEEINILNTNRIVDGVSEVVNPVKNCLMDVLYETEEYTYQIEVDICSGDVHNPLIPIYPNAWDMTTMGEWFPQVDDYQLSVIDSERVPLSEARPFPFPTITADSAGTGNVTSVWIFTLSKRREILNIPEINGTWSAVPVVSPAWTFRNYQTILGNNNKHYSRPYTYATSSTTAGVATPPNNYYHTIWRLVTTSDVTFTNCRRLRSVIDYMLAEVGFGTHYSSFFYDNVNPLTQAPQKLKNLFIGQKSDFINPFGSNVSTKALWTLEQALTLFKDMFNCYWYFEGTRLMIENDYFFFNGKSYTIPNETIITVDNQYLIESNKYDTNYTILKGYEKFMCGEQDGVDFIGVPIRYGSCLPDRNSETTRTIADVTTDIAFVYNGNINNSISETGFVLLQTSLTPGLPIENRIENEQGIIAPTKTYVNGHLTWSNIQELYWKKGIRLMRSFNMNNQDVNPVNNPEGEAERIKVREEITFPFCCMNINFYELLRINDTDSAKMIDAKYNLNTEMLTLKLAYNV